MEKIKAMKRDLVKFKERQQKILERSERNTILSDIGSVHMEQSSVGGSRREKNQEKVAKIQQLVSNENINNPQNTTFLSEKLQSRLEHELEVSSSQLVKMNESPSLTKFYDITKKGKNEQFEIRISSKEHLYSKSRNNSKKGSKRSLGYPEQEPGHFNREMVSDFEKNVKVLEVESKEDLTDLEISNTLPGDYKKLVEIDQNFASNNLLSQKYLTLKETPERQDFKKKSIEYITEEYQEHEMDESRSFESKEDPNAMMTEELEFSVDPFENKKFVNSHNLNDSNLKSNSEFDNDRQSFQEKCPMIETGRGARELQSRRSQRGEEYRADPKQESHVLGRPFEEIQSYHAHTISKIYYFANCSIIQRQK